MTVEFATQVVQKLTEAGYVAYWAGGCVRDLLRGVDPHDYDVATSATPEQVREVFGAKRSLAVGESFGVVIVLGRKGSGNSVEVATFRRDAEYLDGRRPSRVEYCTAEEDARRRDFTINGMFYDPIQKKVYDYVGGELDLQRQIVRAIGNPYDRMTEDKLRVLRAVRFTAVLGYELEPATADAIRGLAGNISQVSAERIAQELRKILAHPSRARAMQLCLDLGLLEVIFPEVISLTVNQRGEGWPERMKVLHELGESTFTTGLAALLRDLPVDQVRTSRQSPAVGTVGSVAQRLRLSNEETFQVSWLVANQGRLKDLAQRTLSEIKPLLANPLFTALLQIERCVALVSGESLEPFKWIEEFREKTPPEELDPPHLMSGDDLIRQGFPPSNRFKHWLQAVRDAQLNNEISTLEQALQLVRRLQEQSKGPPLSDS